MDMALDQQALALTKAIRDVESGGDYNIKGASGEGGAYQFMPGTWKTWAGKYLGDPNAPQDRINQNKVAYSRIKERKDAGLTAAQIASEWNSGKPDAYKQNWRGVNSMGVAYDTPAYVAKVKTAYAKYKPQTSITTQTIQPQQKQGVVGTVANKIGDFLGAGTLGRALGGTAAVMSGADKMVNEAGQTNAEANQKFAELLKRPDVSEEQKTRIRKMLGQGQEIAPELDVAKAIPETQYTPKQIYGSALQTAANVLPFGVGGPAKSFLGKEITAVGTRLAPTVLGRAGQAAIAGAGTGLALGAGRAMEENQDLGGIATSGLKGAALGGALGGAFEGIGQVANKIAPKVAGKIAGSALKETIGETKKAVKTKGETLGDIAVRRGVVGTDKQIYSRAQAEMKTAEDKLQAALKPNTNVVTRKEVRNSKPVKELLTKLKKTIGSKEDVIKVEKIINEVPKEVRIATANARKRLIYQKLGDPAYKLNPTLSTDKEALKAVARALKELIEEKSTYTAGKGTVRQLNRDLSEWGKLRDAALDNLVRKERNQIIGLSDYGALGTGALAGGAPGAIATMAVKRLAGSTWGKTAGAFALNRISKAIQEIAPQSSEKVAEQLKKMPVRYVLQLSDMALKNLIKDFAASSA